MRGIKSDLISDAVTVSFRGSADVIFPPQMDANVSNATFDNATYTTSLRLSVPQPPPGGLFAIVVGVSGSRRNASAPLSSGITDLSIVPDRQLAPSRSVGQSPAATFWGSPLLRAVAPLHHVRFMQVSTAWCEITWSESDPWSRHSGRLAGT